MTDKKVNNSEFRPISWGEVRAGDILMHNNGDRMTVRGVGERFSVAGLSLGSASWQTLGFSPYRKVEPLPTEPGAYADKDGEAWDLNPISRRWINSHGFSFTPAEVADRAPFTRLVPMPSEEEVRQAIALDYDEPFGIDHATAAVMALLAPKGGETDG